MFEDLLVLPNDLLYSNNIPLFIRLWRTLVWQEVKAAVTWIYLWMCLLRGRLFFTEIRQDKRVLHTMLRTMEENNLMYGMQKTY